MSLCILALVAAAVVSVLLLGGCNQPGETRAEISRRHDRVLRLNGEMMMSDIDKVLGLDQPSRLTDKRIP